MSEPGAIDLRVLGPDDASWLEAMSAMFGEAFDDSESYVSRRPSRSYLARLLARDTFLAIVALDGDAVVGGIAAYELHKFEQERSEIYLYDLAVLASHRRRGIATALIERLRSVARARGADVIFVQADTGEDDQAAIALYTKLGAREEVLHFDIAVEAEDPSGDDG